MASSNNKVSGNNLTQNAFQAGATEGYVNTWDSSYPHGGNYWSDYAGVDVKSGATQSLPGSDGIGDSQFVISTSVVDHYPLIAPHIQ